MKKRDKISKGTELELREIMCRSFADAAEKTVIKVVEYLKESPESFYAFKHLPPFNSSKLEGVDWSRLESAELLEGVLTLKFR